MMSLSASAFLLHFFFTGRQRCRGIMGMLFSEGTVISSILLIYLGKRPSSFKAGKSIENGY